MAGAAHSDSIIISVNNTPPIVNITSPVKNSTYTIGGDVVYPCTATVTDGQHSGSQLKYEWQTILRHNNHEHPEGIDNNVSTSTTISRIGCNGDTYYWMVRLKVTDAAGLSATDSSKIFPNCNTDNTPPTVTTVSPASGATGVSTATAITATFNEPINPATLTVTTVQLKNGANVIATSLGISSNQVTLTPSAALANSTTYTVTILGGASGVKDVAGNALAANYTWSFTAAATSSQVPLTINGFDTKTGMAATVHSLTGVPAGALLVLATTADALPSNSIVSSSPSLTWIKRADAGATSSDNAEIWTAVYSAGGAITVTSNWGADNSQSSVCYVVLNAETSLAGASATAVLQTAPSVTITTTKENSIIFGCTADWRAINGATRTLRDAAIERFYFRDGHFTTYHYTKAATSIAAYTEGVSLPTGQQASTALLEIRTGVAVVDNVPPTVTSVSPINGTTGVPVTTTISAVFNEPMNAATINSSTIELRNPSNTLIAATVSYNATTRTATLTPSASLANSTVYMAKIKSGATGVKDVAGNALLADYNWSFTTVVADVTAPTVTSVNPLNGATAIPVTATVAAIFNEGMNAATITTSTIELRNPSSVLVAATVSYNAATRTATLTPSAPLSNSTLYTITVKGGLSGVKDLSGNSLAADFTSSFTTVIADIIAPTVSSVTPANGATGVTVGTAVSAVFNEAMNASTINSSTIELRNPANALIATTISYNAGTRTATLTPTASLAASTLYTTKVISGPSGVKDVAGNALASDYTWSFTTGSAPPQLPVTIQSFDTKTGTSSTVHSLTAVPAGALLVLATTADALPSNSIVTSSPALTWTKRVDAGATSSDNAEIWTAVYAAGGAIAVTSNWGQDNSQSSVCYVVLNAEATLGGASATAVLQSAPSVTITTTRANSIIFGCTADWRAINGATRTLRDAATERFYFKDGNFTTYHYTKAASSIGSYTEGVSLPTGQQASTALLEIRSAAPVAARTANSAITALSNPNSNVYTYSLGQNYPNPFGKRTSIPFTLSREEKVNMVLFDISGRIVKVLLNASKDAGSHVVNFNAGSLAKGVYYYRVQAGDFIEVKKLTIW